MTLQEYIQNEHGGNKLQASKALKLTRRMIYRYLKQESYPVRKKAVAALKNAGIEVPHL